MHNDDSQGELQAYRPSAGLAVSIDDPVQNSCGNVRNIATSERDEISI